MTAAPEAPIEVPIEQLERGDETPEKPAESVFDLPPEVEGIPAVKWLEVGQPPAFRILPGEFFPDLEPLRDKLPEVVESGLDLYAASNGEQVLFNPLFISQAELQQADSQGKLASIIPDYASLSGQEPVKLSDAEQKVVQKKADAASRRMQEWLDQDQQEAMEAPGAPAPGAAAPMTTVPMPKPPPAKTQNAINRARLQGLMPANQGPTSGPLPGQGRILNSLLKPAI